MINVSIGIEANADSAVRGFRELKSAVAASCEGSSKAWKAMTKSFMNDTNELINDAKRAKLKSRFLETPEGQSTMRKQAEAEMAIENEIRLEKELNEEYRVGTITIQEKGMLAEEFDDAEVQRIGRQTIAQRALNDLAAEAMAKTRQELMMMSIGLFVVGITANQFLTTLQGLFKQGTMLNETIGAIGVSLKMALSPLQLFTAALQLMTIKTTEFLIAGGEVFLVLFAIVLLYKAFTTQSAGTRAVLAGLAAGMIALALAMSIATKSNWLFVYSEIAKMSTMTWGTALPLILGALIAGAAVAGIAYAAFPKAQTMTGYTREIKDTGLFYGHRGEMVGRVGGPLPGGSGGINININIESGANIDDATITTMTESIRRSLATGVSR